MPETRKRPLLHVRFIRSKRFPWGLVWRTRRGGFAIHARSLRELCVAVWRNHLSPSARRKIADRQAFYRSGLPRWMYDILHHGNRAHD